MFIWILDMLHGVSRENFETQVKLMNTFGWSDSEFTTAIDVLQRKMEFLTKDVGFTPSDVVNHPKILVLSLEKRLTPRFHALELLKSEGLWTSRDNLPAFFLSPGPNFLQKHVLPRRDKLLKLLEILWAVAEFEENYFNCEREQGFICVWFLSLEALISNQSCDFLKVYLLFSCSIIYSCNCYCGHEDAGFSPIFMLNQPDWL